MTERTSGKKTGIRVLTAALALLMAVQLFFIPGTAQAAGTVSRVVVSQAGYSANDFKVAFVVATDALSDKSYQILSGTTVVASGIMADEGMVWGKRVYSVDFSAYTTTGTNFTVKSNGVASYTFSIAANMWDGYKDEMTAFYRMLRTTDTTVACPAGYSTVSPSAKAFHPASFLDCGMDKDTGTRYDFTGGWFDAGDYGKYGGNQWVQGNIALTYVRNAAYSGIHYDNDANGIPDLIDEAAYGCEYLIKFANQTGGALYSFKQYTSFQHPEKATDNVAGTADDPFFILNTTTGTSEIQTGGSAKAAASLAATSRAINLALANGRIASGQIAAMQAFSASCQSAAVTCYNYANTHQTGTEGSYSTLGGIVNPLLLAETELYLLTNNAAYATAAAGRINALTINDIRCTNYWDMRPLAMAEFYPVADAGTKTKIQTLLKYEMDYFVSAADDTVYGAVNEYGNFGTNEPLSSYVGDAVRYFELFGDQTVLRAAQRAMYWMMGNNPWNMSFVSGIGTDYVDYLHTRLDENVKNTSNTGIVIPGALVSGPNFKDPMNPKSEAPWYQDRPFFNDDTNQWRYNEFSVSIESGFFYAMFGLARQNGVSTAAATAPAKINVTWPNIGDYVTGDVKVFAQPASSLSAMHWMTSWNAAAVNAMTATNGIWNTTVNVDAEAPFANKRMVIRGTLPSGAYDYSNLHYTVAPSLPDPSHPLLYDGFGNDGTWGSQKLGWANWYNQNGGTGTYTTTTDGSTTVGKFTQTSTATNSYAKFEPWHDTVDLSGYRYLNFTMKNPGYANSRLKIEINDGTKTYQLSGGYLNVPTSWTNYSYDLNALSGLTDKSKMHINIWLNQTAVGYGEMLIDQITASTPAAGSAPVLSNVAVSAATGTDTTPYTFTATYTDANNEKPFKVQVILDGVVRDMTEVNAADVTYSDGKDYSYTTLLPAGAHSYYVRTTDNTSNLVKSATAAGPVVSVGTVVYEAENLVTSAMSSGDTRVQILDTAAGTGKLDKFNDNAVNDYLEYKVCAPQPGTYNVRVRIRKSTDSGIFQLTVDGVNQGAATDAYASASTYADIDLGNLTVTSAGDKLFRFKMTGKNTSGLGYKLFTDYVTLTKQ